MKCCWLFGGTDGEYWSIDIDMSTTWMPADVDWSGGPRQVTDWDLVHIRDDVWMFSYQPSRTVWFLFGFPDGTTPPVWRMYETVFSSHRHADDQL